MKPLRALLLPLLVAFLAAVPPAHAQQGRIVFGETEHAFGDIDEGVEARHVFTFRNDGAAPLRLTSVRPSCGCTSPEWTRDPIAPGATGTITVAYHSAGRPGPFHKSINVESDGDPGLVILYIEGNVRPVALTDAYRQGNLRIDREAADVGAVVQGQSGYHTFTLQNAGERPIRFTKLVRVPENVRIEIPPAPLFAEETVQLTVTVDTAGLAAGQPFDYAIVVETDDQDQPVKSFRLMGNVAAATN